MQELLRVNSDKGSTEIDVLRTVRRKGQEMHILNYEGCPEEMEVKDADWLALVGTSMQVSVLPGPSLSHVHIRLAPWEGPACAPPSPHP